MKTILIGLMASAFIFLGCLFGTAVGALVGALAGLVFDGSFALLAQALGIPNAEPYQLGAIFGFVGSFFKSSMSVERK